LPPGFVRNEVQDETCHGAAKGEAGPKAPSRADYARASQQGLPRRSQRRSRAESPFNERTTLGQASKACHGAAKGEAGPKSPSTSGLRPGKPARVATATPSGPHLARA